MRRSARVAAIIILAGASLQLGGCSSDPSDGGDGTSASTGDATGGGTEGDTGDTGDTATSGDDPDATSSTGEPDAGPPEDVPTTPPQVTWAADYLDLGEEFVLRGVWGADPNQVVAVGNKSTILEYSDGEWAVSHQNTELDTLNAVWGTSMNNVWAVGAKGAILHRDGSGWDIGSGCTNDSACDDGDQCTLDTCGADGKCIYNGTGSPGCCGSQTLNDNFESGMLFPWFVEDLSADQLGMVWNVAALTAPGTDEPRATSGVYSLYFGNPEQHNFDNGTIVASRAVSGKMAIPDASEVRVDFNIFIDSESSSSWDIVELRVLSEGIPTMVWAKGDVGGTTGGVFVPATADLTQWAGSTVQLEFFFDSADPLVNNGEGVFIDDVIVSTTCGTATGLRFPTLWDVWGSGPDDVYAVGNEGTIIHFDGTSWKRQAGGEANDLFAVGGNAGVVAAGGAEGEVFTTLAGGLSVDKAATNNTIRDMVLQDGDEAIGVGDQGTIVRYVNGAWLSETTPTSADLRGAWTDGADTVVVGTNGTVLRQLANGPWVLEDSGQTGEINAIWGVATNELLAVGDSGGSKRGMLLEYDGTSWNDLGDLVSSEFRGVHGFGSGGAAFAVGGGGTVARRADGVWTQDSSPTTFALHSVWGADESQVWAVGNTGTLLLYNGTSWGEADSPTNLALHDIWGRSANDAYAVGASGVMLQWDGVQWTVLRSNTTANLRAVWGLAPDNVYAVGAKATIMHFNGLNWSQIKVEDEVHGGEPTPVVNQLFDVWGTANDRLFAVGADGTLIQTEVSQTTGDILWVKSPQQDNDVTVRGLVGQDDENLWMFGRDGLILHFEPPAMSSEESESIATLYDAFRFDNGEIITVGNLATILRRGVFAE